MVKQKFPASYKKGYLNVPGGHELYYELYGNPKGVPVLFFHGGPGGGISEKQKGYFNPQKHNVIFYDQRGSGKSKPFASLENNTTQDLISDAKRLLDNLGLKKVFLFGGSWGSTMALLFTIAYPKMVTGMMLRGVFMATKEEVKHYIGGGAVTHFPDVWERFMSLVPESKKNNIIEYYLSQMHAENDETKEKHLYEWSFYEYSISQLEFNPSKIEKELKADKSYRSLSPIEAHYMLNNCFLKDNFILKNARKIENIPTVIVQGRYDYVCPPKYAYSLHKKLKNSKLYFVIAGHSGYDPEIHKKLVEEMEKISK